MWQRRDKLDQWVEECIFQPLRIVYSNPAENPQTGLTPEGKRVETQVRDLIKMTMRRRAVII